MVDKQRKLKDKASRYYADGKLKDALKVYEQIVFEDSTELQCQIKIGDIHRRLGHREAAVGAYEPVARYYAEDGMLLKAIAVCKLILSTDPKHTSTQTMLANLYAKRRGPARAPVAVKPSPRIELDQMTPLPTLATSEPIELPDAEAEVPLIQGNAPPQTSAPLPKAPQWPPASAQVPPPTLQGTPPPTLQGTPLPQVGWPTSANTPPINPPQPANVASAWPTATPQPNLQNVPEIVVGQKLEDSVLDITVDGVLTEEELIERERRRFEQGQGIQPPQPAAPSEAVIEEPIELDFSVAMEPAVEASQPPQEALAEAMAQDTGAEIQNLLGSLSDESQNPEEPEKPALPTGENAPDIEAIPDEPIELTQPKEHSASMEETWSGEIKLEELEGDIRPEQVDAGPVMLSSEGVEVDSPIAIAELEDAIPLELTEKAEPEVSAEPIELVNPIKTGSLPLQVEEPGEGTLDLTDEVSGEHSLGTAQIPLFSDLPKNAFIELLVQMDMRDMDPGEYVIREGEIGDSFFVVASGKVRVVRTGESAEELVLAYLTDGAFFGEMALLQDGARTASVVVEEPSQIFEINKAAIDAVVARFPSVATVLRNFYKQRMLSTTMATHPLFKPFGEDERRGLMEMFKSKNFDQGSVLVKEGKKGTGLFLLLHGRLKVAKAHNGGELLLAELSPGEMFGEMSLLTNQPTVASVTAVTDCFILRLSKRKFDEVIMTHPQVLELVAKISEERNETNDILLGKRPMIPPEGAILV